MEAQQSAVTEKKNKKQIKWWYPAKGRRNSKDPNTWISTYYRKFKNPTISFRISPASYFDNRAMIHLDLLWVSWYIHLPLYSNIDECDYPEFGFYYYSNALVLCWGMKKKFIHMPWEYTWVRTSKLLKDGNWMHETKGNRKKYTKEEDQWELENLWSETHHVTYVTSGGKIQDDIEATIKIEEREWRQKWLKWTKFGRKVSRDLAVEFNNEVGNQRGSWKGGVLGSSIKMKPDEKPLTALRRMMKERNFDR